MAEPEPLNIAIIGAGVAGLSAALALNRMNMAHKITVYESAATLSELGAGLQLFSNATRVLCSWGLQAEFERCVHQPRVMQMRHFRDDSVVGEIAHNPQAGWQYGAPHWQIFRPDLQRILAEACAAAGPERVRIRFGQRVKAVDASAGSVTFEDGAVEVADLVVSADGLRSRTRAMCDPRRNGSEVPARPFGEYCYRAVIPRADMLAAGQDLADLMAGGESMIWAGPGICMLGYPVAGGSIYNALVSIPDAAAKDGVGQWSQAGDVKEVARRLEAFPNERVRKLWGLVKKCNQWTLGDVPPLSTYASPNGRHVLVGDAAHAILPHSGQGAAMALEDAAALAAFLARLPNKSLLPEYIGAWSAFRVARLANVRRMALGNQTLLTMPDGPATDKRDALWAGMTKAWKDELASIGEEAWKLKARAVKADENAEDIRSPEGRKYFYGYDILSESERAAKLVKQ